MKKIPKSPVSIPSKNIKKIHYSGLSGRIAHFPAEMKGAKKTFVIVAGQHSSHERMMAFIGFLAEYGEVYAIDMPGFGGMNSFRKIGKEVSLDNYAEYLYTVLKTQKLTKNISIFSVSIGGEFVTRMFQKYPDSQKWVDAMLGFVTFGAKKDFHLKPLVKIPVSIIVRLVLNPVGRAFLWLLFFNPLSLRVVLTVFSKFKKKMRSDDPDIKKKMVQMEYYHWRINDLYTWAKTIKIMFTKDLRKYSRNMISVPLHNILTKDDQYVDAKEVNKTLRDLYENYSLHYLKLDVHMPSLMADKSEVINVFDQATIDEIMGSKDSVT